MPCFAHPEQSPPRPRTRRRLPALTASALLGATVLSMPFIPSQAMAQEQPRTAEQGGAQQSGAQAPSTPRMPDIGETGVTQAQDQAETVILPGTRANPFDIPEFELPTGSAYAAYQRGFYLTAFALATSQAGQGDRSAQTLLGELYLKGQGIPRDAEQAADWFELAAEENDPEAQFSLGMLYATGNGVKKDLSHALELFEKAANNGQKNAQFNLGMLYLQGQIVGQDITRAMDLFTKSATQGLAECAICAGQPLSLGSLPHSQLRAGAILDVSGGPLRICRRATRIWPDAVQGRRDRAGL